MTIKKIQIDPSKITGCIKPMHGVGAGPVTGNFTYDATEQFKAAGIPFGRTHDIEYPFGSGEFVDIHCIFPCFEADENDPASYNFSLTDEYLRLMLDAGTEPFYRLGSTIEHQPIKRHIHPPKDFAKWARICSHIIAHYNEGWADGYKWNIRYWEVWNEPDIPQCWTGTQDEIFELYRIASTTIKRDHPDIRIGGIALTSPRSPMFEPFLAYAQQYALPLDFVSWHGYCHTPKEAEMLSGIARCLMDKYGFTKAESIYNEWNYVVNWDDLQPSLDLHLTPFAAAYMSSVIAAMQAASVDKLMFYDSQALVTAWNNLFVPKPQKAHAARRGVNVLPGYWALYGWNELYKAGNEIACDTSEDLYCAAAMSTTDDILVYVSYFNDDAGLNASPPDQTDVSIEFPEKKPEHLSIFRVDSEHSFEEETITGNKFTMQGNSFALIKIKY